MLKKYLLKLWAGFNWLKVALTEHYCEDDNAFMDS
jgi:hypothetical protein